MTNKNYGKRCYETHPALDVGGFKVYGGSCGYPIVEDADIYIGFDPFMQKSKKVYPWEPGESFLFPIADMHAPTDPDQTKKLVEWVALQLTAQKKIHMGCVGGHGRTGTILAALVKVMIGEADAIRYVRENYCPKAVESVEQVDFLHKHFGIIRAEASKVTFFGSIGKTPDKYQWANYPTVKAPKLNVPVGTALPARNTFCIWGSEIVTLDKPLQSAIITV